MTPRPDRHQRWCGAVSPSRDLWLFSSLPTRLPKGSVAWRDSMAVPFHASPFVTPALGGTGSEECCGHRAQWCGLVLRTSNKSDGDNGNQWGKGRWRVREGWALELPWLLHVGTVPVLLPAIPALEVRFQQLLPQRGCDGDGRTVQPGAPSLLSPLRHVPLVGRSQPRLLSRAPFPHLRRAGTVRSFAEGLGKLPFIEDTGMLEGEIQGRMKGGSSPPCPSVAGVLALGG